MSAVVTPVLYEGKMQQISYNNTRYMVTTCPCCGSLLSVNFPLEEKEYSCSICSGQMKIRLEKHPSHPLIQQVVAESVCGQVVN
jgi:hypothetical protein